MLGLPIDEASLWPLSNLWPLSKLRPIRPCSKRVGAELVPHFHPSARDAALDAKSAQSRLMGLREGLNHAAKRPRTVEASIFGQGACLVVPGGGRDRVERCG